MTAAVADKLREARALIERGWCRGDYRKGLHYCVYGAVQQIANGDAFDCSTTPLRRQMVAAIRSAVGQETLISWNDYLKSKRPVLAAFDKAIELAEAQL